MARRRFRQFCRALHQEIGDYPPRWNTITAVADRMDIGQEETEALAAELEAANLMLIGGDHSVTLMALSRLIGGSRSSDPSPTGA